MDSANKISYHDSMKNMDALMHPEMFNSFNLVPDESGFILLMRHSIRYEINDGEEGFDVPLTPEGIKLAEYFGQHLKNPIGLIKSSPSGRCIETGQAISRGAKTNIDVISEPLLSQPGLLAADLNKARQWFSTYDSSILVNETLNGNRLAGVHSPEKINRLIMDTLFGIPPKPKEINIFITHDTILAYLIYYIMGKKHVSEEMWPWMLEGCLLWKNKTNLNWIWRGQKGLKENVF